MIIYTINKKTGVQIEQTVPQNFHSWQIAIPGFQDSQFGPDTHFLSFCHDLFLNLKSQTTIRHYFFFFLPN